MMIGIEKLDDLGTFYSGFYNDKRKATSGAPEPGQIVMCPVNETDRRPFIGDVRRVDSQSHGEITLHIREQQKGDYRGKDNRLPIAGLKLERTHEIVVCRAKLRPCLVLACCRGLNPEDLPEGPQKKLAHKAFFPVFLLAPIFSVSVGNEPRAFGPIVTARIRCLMYPEFLYLRQSGGYLPNHSVARLDRIFLGAPHPGNGFETTELFLMDEIMGVALEQVRILLGQAVSKEYADLRAMMLSFLPKT